MDFHGAEPIYQQIGDSISYSILRGSRKKGERIPSVREMAVSMEVNPNTVQRAYASLQDEGIIQNKRGIGYFVQDSAYERVKEMKTQEFISDELPRLFKMMELLGLTVDDLGKYFEDYRKNNNKDKSQ